MWGSAATAAKSRVSSASTALLADLGTLDTQVKNATGWIGSERDIYIETFENWRRAQDAMGQVLDGVQKLVGAGNDATNEFKAQVIKMLDA